MATMPMGAEDRAMRAIQARTGFSRQQVYSQFELDPFWYNVSYIPAASAVISTANFLVQADSAFAIVKTMGTITSSVDALVANITDTPKFSPYLVTFSDSGAGRDLMDTGTPWDNVIGTGERPYFWPKAKVLNPNTTFTVRVQNLNATAFNVRISFGGFKVFGNIQAFMQSPLKMAGVGRAALGG